MRYLLVLLLVFSACSGTVDVSGINDVIDELTTDNDDRDIDDDSDLTEEGIVIVEGKPENLNFVGTFEKRAGFQFCIEFPQIIRMYSKNDKVYIETNRGELISKGKVFQDGTIDFDIDVYNDLYGYSYSLPCTCDYDPDTWYGKKLDCDCESCDIIFEEFE